MGGFGVYMWRVGFQPIRMVLLNISAKIINIEIGKKTQQIRFTPTREKNTPGFLDFIKLNDLQLTFHSCCG